MKSDIRQKLREALNIPSFRLPQKVDISDEERTKIQNVRWNNLGLEDLGGQGNIAYIKVIFPFETAANNGGVVVDLQVLNNTIFQPHIHMVDNLQGLGIGYKVYQKVISEFGHLYSGKGRRMNPRITSIWEKLKKGGEFDCMSNQNGDMCMVKGHSDAQPLIDFMGGTPPHQE